MSIRLHIDRLIVDGVPLSTQQARTLRAEVEARLAERFAAVVTDRRTGYTLDSLSVAPVVWNAGARNPARSIADSLHTALAQSGLTASVPANTRA